MTPAPHSNTDRETISGEERCPECGYCLRSLPEGSACPECGVVPDPDVLVLYGHSPGMVYASSRPWIRKIAPLFWVWAVLLVCSRFGLMEELYVPGIWALGAGLIPLIVYLRVRRAKAAGFAGPVQLRLCPKGFGIREGPGPVIIQLWHRLDLWTIQRQKLSKDRFTLRVQRSFLRHWIHSYTVLDFSFQSDLDCIKKIEARLYQWIQHLKLRSLRVPDTDTAK